MRSSEAYILKQEEPFKMILLQLQLILESTIPELDLKYKWKLPFYYLYNKPFCFFNVSKGYVDLGIVKGDENQVHKDKLVYKNRKKMVSLRYYQIQDIEVDVLVSVLLKAKELYILLPNYNLKNRS